MRKINLMAGAAAASAVVIGGLVPATASASTAASSGSAAQSARAGHVQVVQDLNCSQTRAKHYPNGKVQVYDKYNCKGRAVCKDYDHDSDYRKGGDCKNADNRASSVINLGWRRGNSDVRFYKQPFYTGQALCLKNGQYISKLRNYNFNNAISSHRWVGKC